MSPPLYRVRRGLVASPGGVLLEDLDFDLADRAVTALLGPAGTGKSTLLRVLAGDPLPPGWKLAGTWSYRGRPLTLTHPVAAGEIHLMPQRPHAPLRRTPGADLPKALADALASPAGTLLLDEPERPADDGLRAELVSALRARAASGAVVLVTHDLALARESADHTLLFCAGRLAAAGPTREIFESPPNRIAARFVAQGNSSASPPPLAVPSHFHWILPGRLAGMGRPGLTGDVDIDLEAIAAAGIRLLVTLTSDALPAGRLRSFGLQGRHLPIVDMGVPALGTAARMCRDIVRSIDQGEAVAVHCHAGLGRTGLMLAAILVWQGLGPDEAIARLRAVVPGYIQSRAQEVFVHRFAASVGPSATAAARPEAE